MHKVFSGERIRKENNMKINIYGPFTNKRRGFGIGLEYMWRFMDIHMFSIALGFWLIVITVARKEQ